MEAKRVKELKEKQNRASERFKHQELKHKTPKLLLPRVPQFRSCRTRRPLDYLKRPKLVS